METIEKKLLDVIRKEKSEKEETLILDEFISKNCSETQFENEIYYEIFKTLLNNKLKIVENFDNLNFLKICQTIRLISRNRKIQVLINFIKKTLYSTETISNIEAILEYIIHSDTNENKEIKENILIEIISIMKRFSNSKDMDAKIFNTFIESKLIDNMIQLLSRDNLILIKNLHSFLLSFLDRHEILSKFSKTYNVIENIIQIIRDKNKDIAKLILDLLIVLVENKNFRDDFTYLEGHLMIINKLKNFDKLDRELIQRYLYIIQIIYKNEDTLGDLSYSNIITTLFQILNTYNNDFHISKLILNIFSAFALNDDLNLMIRMNWLEGLIKTLIDYNLKFKSCENETEKNNILHNQSLIVRILRLIFSLEKNRKYFKHLFPTKLLGIFIDIGNYKHNLELYHSFLEEFNSLSEEEILNLKHKSQNISNPSNEAQTIGGYTIMELIGKGGFGSVYKVKLGNLYFAMKEVVLEEKEIKRMKMLKNKNEENFINEIEILKDLDHPNIIKYYTSFFEKDRVYILMELVEGVNLAEYILSLKQKGAKGKEKDILKIVLDIICAMKYLHMEKGILYRDINPHNVMIDKDFNVKLGDFGLARRLGKEKTEHSTSTQTAFVGSILYSAPEVVMNLPYTEKSDIWSIGCILYQLLMMEPPFDGDNPLAIAKDIVELKYRPLAEEVKSTLLGSIVMKCLVFEKDARPDIEQISCMMGGYLVDKLNFLKREENELKIENDFLKERTYKLELAFNSTNNLNANINLTHNNFLSNTGLGFKEFNNANYNHLPNSPNINLVSSERENQFKQSVFKRVSDPLTKVIEMINKLLFLCETPLSNAQDEKYVFIHKFKRKLFSNRDYWNANLVKNEINKLINFSKEFINFELDETAYENFNSTGMKKSDYFKSRITYDILYHYIEELLINRKYYENK